MPVCIAGMHRSGTSLTAHLLHLSGLYLGEAADLPAPAADNPAGFWEHAGFAEINEAILAQLGGGWDLPPALPAGWEHAPALEPWRERAAALIERMAGHGPWGWKDPRNSLTLPFWQALLPGLQVVVCLRNPLEVARSLHRRNRTSPALGLHLWRQYTRHALAAARPEDRVITHYDAYFTDPRAELRRVHDRLGLAASPETIDHACRTAPLPLRHYHATAQELVESGASAEVVQAYLLACAEAGYEPGLQAAEGPLASETLPVAASPAGPGLGQWAEARTARLEAELGAAKKSLDEIYVSERWRFARSVWPVAGPIWTAAIGAVRSGRRAVRGLAARLARRRALAALGGPTAYDLIVLPIIDWRYRFQRPQQLARQFARRGQRVFYGQTTFHSFGEWAALEQIEPNVFGFQLPGNEGLDLYRDALEPEAVERCLAALDDLRRRAGTNQAACLVQLPFWAPLALAARERWGWKVVYDCLDEHAGFADTGRAMLGHEAPLMAGSDLVVAASGALYEKAVRLTGRALRLPNAADFEHFNRAEVKPASLPYPGPIIGYFGAIAEWFDVEMVQAAACSHPDWQFVLVGRAAIDTGPLRRLANVHLLGEQPYASLPATLRRFDVACLPFRLTPLTRATDPVKFYEYLSAGKPVVATALPELEPRQDLFYPVRSPAEFAPQIEAALAERNSGLAQARIEFARRNTWQARAETLHRELAGQFGKAVVVVVSYRQPDYLRRCLDSLWANTDYPNFEVVVVDNNSGPEVRETLQACAAAEPRLKIILNEDNLGFARACNAGLRAAGNCVYLALLNNDTLVTRGWLSGLIRWADDPTVGLAGPVTNWAGNKARIPVSYRDPLGLDGFAERHTRQRRGQAFEIPMLALYCAVMRKSVYDEIGPLDERFGLGMFEDDDYSLRLKRAGYRLMCAEDVFVHHWGRASFGQLDPADYDRLFAENRRKFEEKWGRPWQPHRARSG